MLGQLTYLHLGTRDTSNSTACSTLLFDTRIYDWMGARILMCRLNTDNKLCRAQTKYIGVAAARSRKGSIRMSYEMIAQCMRHWPAFCSTCVHCVNLQVVDERREFLALHLHWVRMSCTKNPQRHPSPMMIQGTIWAVQSTVDHSQETAFKFVTKARSIRIQKCLLATSQKPASIIDQINSL